MTRKILAGLLFVFMMSGTNCFASFKTMPNDNNNRNYALLIGSSSKVAPDASAVWDVESLRHILYYDFDYPYENVKTLVGKEATKEAILAAIQKFKKITKGQDKILLYFSGHGVMLDSEGKGTNKAGFEAALVPSNINPDVYAPVIKSSEFFEILKGLGETRDVCIVLDCSHSGHFARKFKDYNLAGVTVLAACGESESAGAFVLPEDLKHFSPDGKLHGVFTLALLAALQNKESDTNEDNGISVLELFENAAERLQKIRKQSKNVTQDCVMSSNKQTSTAQLPFFFFPKDKK